MERIFGTDGIRAQANSVVSPELALRLGRAVVSVLVEEGHTRPEVVVGRDPRWSGEMLEAALVAGITSAGGTAVVAGVLPTPAIAHLTATTDAAAGAVISASHNPVGDNGVKFFGGDGFKLSDAEEDRLEELLHEDLGPRPVGTSIGRVLYVADAIGRYVEHVVASADGVSLSGLSIVVDCANGAASQIAPQVYRHLGARVVSIFDAPDGGNINDGCGSTHPDVVQAAVREHGADIGIAHDGDADRLICADAAGAEVDGDVILAVLAQDAHQRGALAGDAVATTVMTNLGFHHAMSSHGIDVVTTQVGDRYVLQAMRERQLALGGEQSGHLIALDHATTGDGILSAVQLLTTMARREASLADLAGVMTRLPQVLVNVADVDKARLDDADDVWAVVKDVEAGLDGSGRVLVRRSGTEQLVRVMVEAPTEQDARSAADRIAAAVTDSLSLEDA